MSVMSDIKIRPLGGDLHFVHKINNNDVIMRYWFEEPYGLTTNWSRCTFRHLHDQNERRFIIERDTGEPAGLVELVEIDYIHRRAEFQIIIAPSYQGRGSPGGHAHRGGLCLSRAEPAQGLPGGGQGQCRRRPYL